MKKRSTTAAIAASTLALLAVVLPLPATADENAPPTLWKACPNGSAAGQCAAPNSIAASPVTGDVYVADATNLRIDQFTPWGQFVRAFGWGVLNGAAELQSCTSETECQAGVAAQGAGAFQTPRGLATDSEGDLYLVDRSHYRVQKFGPKGEFLLAFGGDVVAHGPDNSSNDEEQELTIAAGSGTFKLSFPNPFASGTAQTGSLPYNVSAAELEAALNGLSTIGGLGGHVSVTGGPGDATGSAPYDIAFEGNVGGDDVPQLQLGRSALGSPSIGGTLRCSTDTEAEATGYAWLRNGAPIAGAESSTYKTTAADEGKSIQCLVRSADAEIGSADASAAYRVAPIPGTALPAPAGEMRVERSGENLSVGGSGGQTLACVAGTWSGSPTLSYQWYRNGIPIGGATGSAYVVTKADLSTPAYFQCGVTGTNAGGTFTKLIVDGYVNVGSRTAVTTGHPFVPLAKAALEPPSNVFTANQGGEPEVCRAATGDVCKAGSPGFGNGQFSPNWGYRGSYVATGPADQVYVGDQERIQVFDSGGEYQSQIPLAKEEVVKTLTVDPVSGDLYADWEFEDLGNEGRKFPVVKIDLGGKVLGSLETDRPMSLAVDRDGNLFVFEEQYNGQTEAVSHRPRFVEFNSAGKRIAVFGGETVPYRTNGKGEYDGGAIATGSACFTQGSGLYVANAGDEQNNFVKAFGIPDDTESCPPPPAAPTITAEYARSVDAEGAVLGADVNPHFWPGATYHVEYATATCIEAGGWGAPCVSRQPAAGGSNLGGGVSSVSISTPDVFLAGLEPGTVYRYRFIAQSPGGGPSLGAGKEFRTPLLAGPPDTACPNQAFRSGTSAPLPDCRAYELVTPLDKGGGDVQVRLDLKDLPARMDQSALSGDGLAFTSYRPFPDAQSAPFSSQYLARREAGIGWRSEAISPPQEGPTFGTVLHQVEHLYQGFSPDLATGWLVTETEPVLGEGGLAGHANIYRRDDGSGTYAGCTTQPPLTPVEALTLPPRLQGVSADHSIGVFRAQYKLTGEADSNTNHQIYSCSYPAIGGPAQLRLVSVLPNGKASTLQNTVGGPANEGLFWGDGYAETVSNAVAANGSKIYWTASNSSGGVLPGALYLRLNPTHTPTEAGPCSEEEPKAACTLQISPSPARFWTAATDGSLAFYGREEEGGKESLYEYDLAARESHLIAHESLGVVGASDSGKRLYFVSRQASPQEQEEGAVAGQPNLYLREAGEGVLTYAFVATLSKRDADEGVTPNYPTAANASPEWHASRVSPDGSAAVFMSNSPALAEAISGYDNTDLQTGEADAEVYRYAVGQGLACISCNPTGARPVGRDVQWKYQKTENFPPYFASALLAPWETILYAPRELSEGGDRVFFESFEALLPADTNGKTDVYEWELKDAGGCKEGTSAYVAASGGCIYLISSGKGAADSEFVDASASGNDVFVRTASPLVPWDPGSIDIYDARVEGGLPAPASKPASCEGEACQGAPSPPSDATPASAYFEGAGNVKEGAARCPKGKVRRHGHCVAKHKKRRRARAKEHR